MDFLQCSLKKTYSNGQWILSTSFMKLIWVNCFLPLDCCYLLATANVAALFLRWSVFPYVLTETAQFSTQHSVSKTKIAIREALHVSKQMYHFHVNILTHSCFTACGSRTPRIVVIVHFRILTYFHLLTARATLQINCTRWYALPVRWCTRTRKFTTRPGAGGQWLRKWVGPTAPRRGNMRARRV